MSDYVDVLRPEFEEPDYHVVVPGGGAQNYVCARATTEVASGLLRPATAMHAKIYPTLGAVEDPRPMNNTTTLGINEPGTDNWYFAEIPNALYGPSHGQENYLAVWAAFPNIGDVRIIRKFFGVQAQDTECAIGSENGGETIVQRVFAPAPAPAGQLLAAVVKSSRCVCTAKRRPPGSLPWIAEHWNVQAFGFAMGTPLQQFYQKNYLLSLSLPINLVANPLVWEYAAANMPTVELRCRSPLAVAWALTLADPNAVLPPPQRQLI